MRKLASIQKILDIRPIPGADKIVVVKVLGWECVALKDEFSVGDDCVYFELDSILPIADWNAHLRKGSDAHKPLRVRTIRLRGQLSQGLALPMSLLPEGQYELGQDVTELVGVKKWEPYIPPEMTGKVKGTRPHFIPKTDEPRCLDGDTLVITEDGKKRISDICREQYQGKALSLNEMTGELEYKNITNHIVSRANDDWYEIEIEGVHKLICTGNHLIYIPELMSYRRADQLSIENNVLYTKN
jgi:hypothetical protein